MKKTVLTVMLVVVLSLTFLLVSLPEVWVRAETNIIVVPNDCPTIEVAIENAMDGDTIFFKKGTHEGPINQTLIIDKSLSIIGENVETTILHLYPRYNMTWILTQSFITSDDAMTINANDVELMNLTLAFIGDIRVNSNRVQIMGNSIKSGSTVTGLIVTGSECNVTNNMILGRINLTGSSNLISQNSFYSLIMQSSDENIIDSNGFKYLQIESCNNNTISGNNISYDNVPYIIEIHDSSTNVFYGNLVEAVYWNTNLRLGVQTQNNTFYGNSFFGEDELISTEAAIYHNLWDNGIYGNFWSNYNGTDLFGDGVGDVPYIINENNKDRYPLINPLNNGESFVHFFPTTIAIASVSIVAVVCIGLFVYFKKHKRSTNGNSA